MNEFTELGENRTDREAYVCVVLTGCEGIRGAAMV